MDVINEMMTLVSGQSTAAIALVVALCSALFAVYSIKKHNRLIKKLNHLNEELQITKRGAIGMGQQIISLEKQLQHLHVKPVTNAVPTDAAAIAMSQIAEITSQQNLKNKTIIEPSIDTLSTVQDVAKSAVATQAVAEDPINDKLALARDLLAKGKALTEVATTCELSFAEVSLLRALNPSNTNPKHTH